MVKGKKKKVEKERVIKVLSVKKTGKRKDISCYNCLSEKAMAYETKREILTIKTGKIKILTGWRRNGWSQISDRLWLCPWCKEFKCEGCEIVLSNTRELNGVNGSTGCNGAYTEESLPFCFYCYSNEKD